MSDRRRYVTELEIKVSKQRGRIKELKRERDEYWGYVEQYRAEAQESRKVIDRQEATLQLRQNLINQREGERDGYKNMCEEYQGEIDDLSDKIALLEADLLTMAEVKDEELQKVLDREHAIHNEAAAGMIAKVKELENTIDYLNAEVLKTQNRNARLEKVIIQKAERIKELQEANSKLQQDVEYNEQLLAQHEEAAGHSPSSLEADLCRAMNYWNTDGWLNTPDFILARHLTRHLESLKKMQGDLREWEGKDIPGIKTVTDADLGAVSDKPTALDELTKKVMLRNARLASISIDDDGLGTIDVIE